MTNANSIHLTVGLVAAFVSNNPVPTGELSMLIEGVHRAFRKLEDGKGEIFSTSKFAAPATSSFRKSITPDYLICLDNGKRFKTLRRHLAALGMTPNQYRIKLHLPSDYPMIAVNYSAKRAELAKKNGLGHLRT